MKKTLWTSLLCLSAAAAYAGEHPEHPKAKEHPKAAAAEHPAHEHPVGSKHWTKQMNKEYAEAVEAHVKAAGAAGLAVKDEVLKKTWSLKLIRIHKSRITHLGDNRFFACADLKPVDKKDKNELDLDFYAKKDGGAWTMEQVLIHKVNGKARYTYNDKNERVPLP